LTNIPIKSPIPRRGFLQSDFSSYFAAFSDLGFSFVDGSGAWSTPFSWRLLSFSSPFHFVLYFCRIVVFVLRELTLLRANCPSQYQERSVNLLSFPPPPPVLGDHHQSQRQSGQCCPNSHLRLFPLMLSSLFLLKDFAPRARLPPPAFSRSVLSSLPPPLSFSPNPSSESRNFYHPTLSLTSHSEMPSALFPLRLTPFFPHPDKDRDTLFLGTLPLPVASRIRHSRIDPLLLQASSPQKFPITDGLPQPSPCCFHFYVLPNISPTHSKSLPGTKSIKPSLYFMPNFS